MFQTKATAIGVLPLQINDEEKRTLFINVITTKVWLNHFFDIFTKTEESYHHHSSQKEVNGKLGRQTNITLQLGPKKIVGEGGRGALPPKFKALFGQEFWGKGEEDQICKVIIDPFPEKNKTKN